MRPTREFPNHRVASPRRRPLPPNGNGRGAYRRAVPSSLRRSRQRGMRRTLVFACRVCVLLLLGILLAGVWTTPRLTLRGVLVKGVKRGDPAEVHRITDTLIGQNMVRATVLQFRKIAHRIRGLPIVESVSLYPWPFREVTAVIRERKDALFFSCGQRLVAADESRTLYRYASPKESPDLVVYGVLPPRWRLGDKVPITLWETVTDCITVTQRLGLGKPTRVSVGKSGGVALLLASGTAVSLGRDKWPEKLALYKELVALARKKGMEPESVDLRSAYGMTWKPRAKVS